MKVTTKMKHTARLHLFAPFALAVLMAIPATPALAASFTDIIAWAGAGGNRAGFVIDWHDGIVEESLMWGFRWDGTATGEDMFLAIDAAAPRLLANTTVGTYGRYVNNIGYDMDEDGFSPTDPDDHYKDDAYPPWWSYWTGTDGSNWAESGVGMTSRALTDGDWDGYSSVVSMWPDPTDPPPGEPAAAAQFPEPGTLALFGFGMIGLAAWRRRRQSSDA